MARLGRREELLGVEAPAFILVELGEGGEHRLDHELAEGLKANPPEAPGVNHLEKLPIGVVPASFKPETIRVGVQVSVRGRATVEGRAGDMASCAAQG